MVTIDRRDYAALYGPTTGDAVRLGDTSLFAVVEKRLRDACQELGLQVLAWFDSPISGGDGNREFFIHSRRAA